MFDTSRPGLWLGSSPRERGGSRISPCRESPQARSGRSTRYLLRRDIRDGASHPPRGRTGAADGNRNRQNPAAPHQTPILGAFLSPNPGAMLPRQGRVVLGPPDVGLARAPAALVLLETPPARRGRLLAKCRETRLFALACSALLLSTLPSAPEKSPGARLLPCQGARPGRPARCVLRGWRGGSSKKMAKRGAEVGDNPLSSVLTGWDRSPATAAGIATPLRAHPALPGGRRRQQHRC